MTLPEPWEVMWVEPPTIYSVEEETFVLKFFSAEVPVELEQLDRLSHLLSLSLCVQRNSFKNTSSNLSVMELRALEGAALFYKSCLWSRL
jgi:hypothetical protein